MFPMAHANRADDEIFTARVEHSTTGAAALNLKAAAVRAPVALAGVAAGRSHYARTASRAGSQGTLGLCRARMSETGTAGVAAPPPRLRQGRCGPYLHQVCWERRARDARAGRRREVWVRPGRARFRCTASGGSLLCTMGNPRDGSRLPHCLAPNFPYVPSAATMNPIVGHGQSSSKEGIEKEEIDEGQNCHFMWLVHAVRSS